jgi:hypothetical protein
MVGDPRTTAQSAKRGAARDDSRCRRMPLIAASCGEG